MFKAKLSFSFANGGYYINNTAAIISTKEYRIEIGTRSTAQFGDLACAMPSRTAVHVSWLQSIGFETLDLIKAGYRRN